MTSKAVDVQRTLQHIKDSEGVILHGFCGRNALRDTMQQAIDAGKECVFVPSLKTLRHFMNTQGFIKMMMDISAELHDHEIIIEPGKYNSRHIFMVGPNS
jgi:orotidine-5'-phosphate decarboxylase